MPGYLPGYAGVAAQGYAGMDTAAKQASHTSTAGDAPLRIAFWCRSRSRQSTDQPQSNTQSRSCPFLALVFNQVDVDAR